MLLAQLPAGLIAVDASGKIELFNAAAAHQWGLDPSALPLNAEALAWCTPQGDALPASSTPLARALRGESLQAERYTLRRQDGTLLKVQCDARPLMGAEGIRGALVLSQPLPQDSSASSSTRQAQPEPASAERALDEFLAIVSHELRTPLNAVLGWASLLRQKKVDAPMMEKALDSIERNARVQARLVEDLLDLGRVVSGKMRVSLRPLEPRSFIAAALETMRSAADAKGVAMEVTLETASSLTISGDPERLQQVVWNLLTNAVKFTPRGGKVHLRAFTEAGQLVVEVQDTGMGIPASFMPYLFERFRQADDGQVKAQRGLGLGLALVRHLVELHGGTVSAASEGEGRGSTFRIFLPLAAIAA
jgi:signal transduction histidine kinase